MREFLERKAPSSPPSNPGLHNQEFSEIVIQQFEPDLDLSFLDEIDILSDIVSNIDNISYNNIDSDSDSEGSTCLESLENFDSFDSSNLNESPETSESTESSASTEVTSSSESTESTTFEAEKLI